MVVPYFLVQSGEIPTRWATQDESMMENAESSFTKAQICKAIKDNAPAGCNVNNFAPAPGIPSPTQGSWAPNGCGPGGWKDFLLAELALTLNPLSFSGDLNRPLLYYQSISFEGACNNHDACYTSSSAKSSCDDGFKQELTFICAGNSSCSSFRNQYYWAVTEAGQSSYDSNQAQFQCAQFGAVYHDNQCGN